MTALDLILLLGFVFLAISALTAIDYIFQLGERIGRESLAEAIKSDLERLGIVAVIASLILLFCFANFLWLGIFYQRKSF